MNGNVMKAGDKFKIYYSANDNYVMDITNGTAANGTNIQLYQNSSTNYSWFGVSSTGDDYYYFTMYASPTYVLDTYNSSSDNNTNI